jgi:hypothetical protein
VYIIVSNASGYYHRRGDNPTNIEMQRPLGEELGLSAEDIAFARAQGQIDTLMKNPTRVTGRRKFDELTDLSAQSGDVSKHTKQLPNKHTYLLNQQLFGD